MFFIFVSWFRGDGKWWVGYRPPVKLVLWKK